MLILALSDIVTAKGRPGCKWIREFDTLDLKAAYPGSAIVITVGKQNREANVLTISVQSFVRKGDALSIVDSASGDLLVFLGLNPDQSSRAGPQFPLS